MAKKKKASKKTKAKKIVKKAVKKTAKTKKRPKKAPVKKASKVLSKKQKQLVKDATHDLWPHERDIIEKPERLKYVRKLIKPKGCVFCTASKTGVGLESLNLYQDDHAMVILNKYPYNNGHLLVLPRVHEGEMENLSDQVYQRVMELVRDSVRILKEVYECPGVNVGMNLGRAAGAGIPEHLHIHIIPRWGGDTNFFPLIAETKVVIETLEQSYGRLIPYFKDLSS